MSCFQCTPEHIAALARLSEDVTREMRRAPQSAREVFRLLWEANDRSVCARYGDAPTPAPAMPKTDLIPLTSKTAGRYLGALACFEYQSCESSDWKQGDPAFDLVETMRAACIRHVPGYAWGWNPAAPV